MEGLLKEVVNKMAYMADTAGLYYSLSLDPCLGLQLKVDGFTHKLPVFAKQLLEALKDLDSAS